MCQNFIIDFFLKNDVLSQQLNNIQIKHTSFSSQKEIDMSLTAYHIGYDEKSISECPNGFKLLSHDNKFPRFREIVPILEELIVRSWSPNEFVGFFSPKFFGKTGLNFEDLKESYQKYKNKKDIVIFSSSLDNAYFWLNPWEHGEWNNPGVEKVSSLFARDHGISEDIINLPVSVDKFSFSHFLIAKKPFWDRWVELTTSYLEFCEKNKTLAELTTTYRNSEHSIHPFIVERFPSLILLENNFSSIQDEKLIDIYRRNDLLTETLLKMNFCKERFDQIQGNQFENEYWALRVMFGTNGNCFTGAAQHYLSKKEIQASIMGVDVTT